MPEVVLVAVILVPAAATQLVHHIDQHQEHKNPSTDQEPRPPPRWPR